MKKHLRLTAALVCLSLLFLLTGCQDSKAFSPSASSTWGELCKQFQPEWYKALPDEVSAQLDSLLLKRTIRPRSASRTPARLRRSIRRLSRVRMTVTPFWAWTTGNLPRGTVQKDNALDYMLSAYSSLETAPTEVCLVIALSDPESGTYQAAAASTVSITNDVDGVAESFQKLKHDHPYKVQAIAIVAPPEGYQSSGPLYVEQEVTTIEPTTK